MRRITRDEVTQGLDADLASRLDEGAPTDVELAVKQFLEGFLRDYRANIARRRSRS